MIFDVLVPLLMIAITAYTKLFILTLLFFFTPFMLLILYILLAPQEGAAGSSGD